jgi:hypothetical protein
MIGYLPGASPASVIAQYLKNGYNGGAWNGIATASTGVITSAAAAGGPAATFGVGFADAADHIAPFQPALTVELRFTRMGDANLDRIVNATDAILMARNYGATGTPRPGTWVISTTTRPSAFRMRRSCRRILIWWRREASPHRQAITTSPIETSTSAASSGSDQTNGTSDAIPRVKHRGNKGRKR